MSPARPVTLKRTGRRLPALSLIAALAFASGPVPAGAQAPPGGRAKTPHPVAASEPTSYASRQEVRVFIDRMVDTHGFERERLMRLFARLRPSERVIHLMTPTTGGSHRRSWRDYRSRFIEPVRINGGVAFWERHGTGLIMESGVGNPPVAIDNEIEIAQRGHQGIERRKRAVRPREDAHRPSVHDLLHDFERFAGARKAGRAWIDGHAQNTLLYHALTCGNL